jgi:small subunit ribosomal protein S6
MARPAPTYDLMLLLDPNAEEDARAKILSDAEALIGREGTVTSRHGWGRRPLAYEIEKQGDAEYSLLQFQAPASTLRELDRVLRITDGVVRFRIIKLAPGTPDVPDLTAPVGAPEQPAGEPQQAL